MDPLEHAHHVRLLVANARFAQRENHLLSELFAVETVSHDPFRHVSLTRNAESVAQHPPSIVLLGSASCRCNWRLISPLFQAQGNYVFPYQCAVEAIVQNTGNLAVEPTFGMMKVILVFVVHLKDRAYLTVVVCVLDITVGWSSYRVVFFRRPRSHLT
jgi:hypothetical protein